MQLLAAAIRGIPALSDYEPDALRLTKAEITAKMEMLIERWKKNPKVNKMFIKKFQLDLALFKSRMVKPEDLPYYWLTMCELFDELRALNARKDKPELQAINPMMEKHFDEKIKTVPTDKTSFSLKAALKAGGMKDG